MENIASHLLVSVVLLSARDDNSVGKPESSQACSQDFSKGGYMCLICMYACISMQE